MRFSCEEKIIRLARSYVHYFQLSSFFIRLKEKKRKMLHIRHVLFMYRFMCEFRNLHFGENSRCEAVSRACAKFTNYLKYLHCQRGASLRIN